VRCYTCLLPLPPPPPARRPLPAGTVNKVQRATRTRARARKSESEREGGEEKGRERAREKEREGEWEGGRETFARHGESCHLCLEFSDLAAPLFALVLDLTGGLELCDQRTQSNKSVFRPLPLLLAHCLHTGGKMCHSHLVGSLVHCLSAPTGSTQKLLLDVLLPQPQSRL